jgi:hypothetical protein
LSVLRPADRRSVCAQKPCAEGLVLTPFWLRVIHLT